MRCSFFFFAGLSLAAAVCTAGVAAPWGPPEPERIETLTKWLPAEPQGVGRPITDRAAWDAVAARGNAAAAIRAAEQLLGKPLPELTDELYLEFSTVGNRTHYQSAMGNRHNRLATLAVAECLENRGRFLDELQRVLLAVCDEKTWVYPAHDRSLANFKGAEITIDLGSSNLAWELTTVDYWLGPRLRPEVRQRLHDELERRIYAPFERMVRKGKPRMWWLVGTNNWNAVCLANVTGAAVTSIPSPERRAFFVASAEKYIQSFLAGFTDDGYCSEGLGYWNYGFGHFVMLGHTLLGQTGGRLDLLADPRVRQIAQFGRRMEILPGVYPAFADCGVSAQPSSWLMHYVDRRYGFGWSNTLGPLATVGGKTDAILLGLLGFPQGLSQSSRSENGTVPLDSPPLDSPPASPQSSPSENGTVPLNTSDSLATQPLRDYFADAGVLICRPAPEAERAMGGALKGGHNAEHHNHNDVGSFVVALGRSAPLGDPGSEVYTSRTFSSRRYESGVLNSWGHPVPRVAGQLQRAGRRAAATVLRTDFTDAKDTFVLDLRAAYDVEELTQLERTFVFDRQGRGSFRVTDRVAFDSPQRFGTALVTFQKWREEGPGRLVIGEGNNAVEVLLEATAEAGVTMPSLQAEEIHEDVHARNLPVRLGLDLDAPVRRATITIVIRPLGP